MLSEGWLLYGTNSTICGSKKIKALENWAERDIEEREAAPCFLQSPHGLHAFLPNPILQYFPIPRLDFKVTIAMSRDSSAFKYSLHFPARTFFRSVFGSSPRAKSLPPFQAENNWSQ